MDSEYVVLENRTAADIDVSGWRLADKVGNEIVIGSGYVIEPGTTIRVYSGPGTATADRYYAGRSQAMWNNSGGDTAKLYDTSGALISEYSYSL